MLESISYKNGDLKIIDQLLLPTEERIVQVHSVEDAYIAIKTMQIRGAPAIAVLGCLSLAVELRKLEDRLRIREFSLEKLERLVSARPTAVNMRNAQRYFVEKFDWTAADVAGRLIGELEDMLEADVATNRSIGATGLQALTEKCAPKHKLNVLTHCNTGSLATAGYGTALGVVRALHEAGRLQHAYCTETRPYNQGARLTAYELHSESIPSTLVCDNMVGALMARGSVDAVVVGADRVARNGDTANKIGTYSIAVLCRYHRIPFYIAAPFTTIDDHCDSGESIEIEERAAHEMTQIAGVQLAPRGMNVWNPAFDVTPAELIEGVVTERGLLRPHEIVGQLLQK